MRLGLAVQNRYNGDSGGYLTAAITYYGFLSLFPLLLLALSIVGFVLVGDPAAQRQWADRLAGALPGLGPLVGRNIHAVVVGRAGAGAIGLLGLAWTGRGAVQASGWALSRIFRVESRGGFVHSIVWSMSSLVVIGALAVASVGVVGVVGGIHSTGLFAFTLHVGGIVLSFLLDLALFAVSYRILVDRRGPPYARLWKGAALAAMGWTALKAVGAWYGAHTVASSTAVYGTFATVVGILVLLYLAARLFVYGAELNAVLIEEEGEGTRERVEGGSMEEHERRETVRGDGQSPPETRSTGELVRDIAQDTTTLVRQEIELAKAEITESVMARLIGAAALGFAAFLGLVAFLLLAAAAAAGLELVVAPWLARLIVAGGLLVLAGPVVLIGLRRMKKRPIAPEETVRTVKEDVAWARKQLKR